MQTLSPPPEPPRPLWPRLHIPTPLDTRCACGLSFAEHSQRWPHAGAGCLGFVPSEGLCQLDAQVHGSKHRRRYIMVELRVTGPSTLRVGLPYEGKLDLTTTALGGVPVFTQVYQLGTLIASWPVVGDATASHRIEVEHEDLVVRVTYAHDENRTAKPYGVLPVPGSRRAR